MRRKTVLATTAGVLIVGGLALAAPALAEDDTTPETSATSAVDRIRDALAGLVDDGSITQEQADEVAATLSDAGAWHGGPGGRHGGWGGWGGGGFPVAAETLGLSEEELRTALEAEGATLASVAEDRGVAVADLVAALVGAAEERIATAVEEGRLTQEEADERLADLEARVTEFVQSADGDGPWWGGRGGPDDEDD
ncbi:hypothetical protein ACI798_09025 [Geodermatophilus sp. SYSU D01045]